MFNFRYDLNKGVNKERAPKQRKQRRAKYRNIKVIDKIDAVKKVRSVTVECPMEYPGLTEKERRRMYEGLAMIADAYRSADARCEAKYKEK